MATERPASAARLLAVAVAAALLVALGAVVTRDRAGRNDARLLDAELAALLPGVRYDNRPAEDAFTVTAPGDLGSDGPLPAWRARQGGAVVAVVLTAVARAGYGGPLRLRVSVDREGRILRARVTGHAETPGVGDAVEDGKSAWMGRFAGRSAGDPPRERWLVRRDGGDFDQITGATVTSRSVVAAVRDAAAYAARERAALFDPPP